jgi:hypothetical protein
VNPRYRIYAALGLAGVVLLGGGFMLLGHGASSSSSAVPVIKPLHPVAKRAKATAKKTAPKMKTTSKAAKAKAAPKVKAKTPLAPPPIRKTDSTKDGMPVALSQALKKHSVVVVSLVLPGANVDELAYQEAKAGAAKAGAGFVRISASNNNDVEALSTLVNANADATNRLLDAPATLVFHQPQDLYVRINGYIDADTVAQAAENAAPLVTVQTTQGTVTDAWVRGANAACEKFKAEIVSTGLPTQPDQVLPWAQNLVAKLRTVVDKLRGLKPPPGKQARVAAMLADYDTMLKALNAEIGAAKGHDLATLQSLNAKARAAGTSGDAIAAELGATACGGSV